MKKTTRLLTLFMVFAVQLIVAQDTTISGTVTDAESGLPLAGVNILIEGTARGTQTDFDGNYSIEASQGETLVFSYIGYADKSVAIGTDTTINVAMQASTAELGEIVLVAYGNQEEQEIVSAISTVDAEKIETIPIASVDQALQGRVAGVDIKVNSGQPGRSGSVIIRGRTSITGDSQPLYIVDGIEVNEDVFRSLDNNSIASISVLKDASATALYGNRAANGVIIIKTKRGEFDSPLTIRYNSLYGVSVRPDPNFQVMNAKQYLTFSRDIFQSGAGVGLTDAEIDAIARKTNTNWAEILYQKGQTISHDISFSKGTETTRTYTSLGYFEQEGITLGSKLERFSFRSNVEVKANEKFDFSTNLTLNYSVSDFVVANARNSFIFGGNTGGELDNPFIVPYIGLPYFSPYNPDGSLNIQGTPQSLVNGPNGFLNTPYLALNTARFNTDQESEFFGIGGIRGNYHFTDHITLGTQFSMTYRYVETLNITDPESIRGSITPNINSQFKGAQTESFNRFTTINFNPYLLYENTFGDHKIDASLQMEYLYENYKLSGFQAFGLNPNLPGSPAGFIPGSLTEGPENDTYYYIPNVFGSELEETLYSVFGNVNYDYDSRYGLSASLRRDGSSRFSEENRWGTFFSVGGRWNIGNENFMDNVDFINTLKLRASYGEVGNKNVGGEIFGAYVGIRRIQLITGYQNFPGYAPVSLVDPDLQWEVTTQTNIGLDFGLFENKLTGSVDVYNKNTEGLFFPKPVTLSSGFSAVNSNVAEVNNKGIEAALSWDIIRNEDWTINVFANGAYNKNEIKSLAGTDFVANGNLQVGEPIRSFYRVRWAGVNPANGNPLYLDKEGNLTQVYSEDDRVFIGKSADPSYVGGFGSNLQYKGFSLDALFSYAADVYRINGSLAILEDVNVAGFANQSVTMLTAWQEPGDITAIPSIASGSTRLQLTDRYVEDASYLRLRNITLGYTFDSDLFPNNFFTTLRVYVQGTNVFTWSKWRGPDPISTFANSFFEYPSPRQFTAGLDITF